MLIISILRIFSFAWQSFWRNFWLSMVTITIIVLTFVSINFVIVLNVVSDAAMQIVKNKIDVSVYFRPDVTEPQVLEVQNYLASMAQVKDIAYISQTDALEKFRQLHRQDTTIIESIEEIGSNPIGATLQIKAKNIDDYPVVMDILSNSKYNDLILDKNFDDHKVYIEKIKGIADKIRQVGLIASGVLSLIALLIVFNTIRVAIYTHRQEIAIMKLVGATNWFIQSPFLLEAVFYGIIACAISVVIAFPVLNLVQPYLNSFFLTNEFSIATYFTQNFWKIFGFELIIIILLNILSSYIAIRRYLRV
ncbi:MAG: permease-like cell division protein FtsX [Candidatus Buchananbacteria bacterium]